MQGTFPVGCAMPASPTKLVLFNVSDLSADMMGTNVLDGVKLAYPRLIDIHRFNSKTLNHQGIAPLLDPNPGHFLVVVCGPVAMNSKVVDMLSEMGGPWARNMRILTSDRPN
jgi:NAD(P)H-flavin reductase